MTTKQARDFLDKELFVNRNIVTFRSLSRELGIHVNSAKNELQHYYDTTCDLDAPAVPTYLVSGETHALPADTCSDVQQSDGVIYLGVGPGEGREEIDVVCQSKVLLVSARALNEARSQFSRTHSVHIYSLSPSQLEDAGLVCAPSFKIREADAKSGPEFCSVVGKITGSHVKLKFGSAYKNMASSVSKTTMAAPARATMETTTSVKTEQQTTTNKYLPSDTREQVSIMTSLPKTESKDRPKLSGKLDWSKAKTKGKDSVAEEAKEDNKPKLELELTITSGAFQASKDLGLRPTKEATSKCESKSVTSDGIQKRGVKGKPQAVTDQESEFQLSPVRAKPSTASGSFLNQMVVCSDDDDDNETRIRVLGRRRPQRKDIVTSDSETSLRAMMDVDDVERVSRISKNHPQCEEEEESSESEKEATALPEEEGDESDDMSIVPKKRKPRKVVPVGRNGIRKRRVVKSLITTDAKGYMRTEDYSSYESVEEEEEGGTKSKGKGRETKKTTEPAIETARIKAMLNEESVGKLKVKPTPRSRGGTTKHGGLLNFFGPERGKK